MENAQRQSTVSGRSTVSNVIYSISKFRMTVLLCVNNLSSLRRHQITNPRPSDWRAVKIVEKAWKATAIRLKGHRKRESRMKRLGLERDTKEGT